MINKMSTRMGVKLSTLSGVKTLEYYKTYKNAIKTLNCTLTDFLMHAYNNEKKNGAIVDVEFNEFKRIFMNELSTFKHI